MAFNIFLYELQKALSYYYRDDALDIAIAISLGLAFLLGVYLGRLSGTFWLFAGLRSALLAISIVFLIYLLG